MFVSTLNREDQQSPHLYHNNDQHIEYDYCARTAYVGRGVSMVFLELVILLRIIQDVYETAANQPMSFYVITHKTNLTR
jgi:hypothetical protein